MTLDTCTSKEEQSNLHGEIEQADEIRASSCPITSKFATPSLPLTWLALRQQATTQGRTTDHPSDFHQSSSHVDDHMVSTHSQASKEYNDCTYHVSSQQHARTQASQCCFAFHGFPDSDRNDCDSSMISCRRMSRNRELLHPTRTKARTSAPSAHCNETFALESNDIARDSSFDDVAQYKVDQIKASKAARSPAVKPLNAYNYFYSEMREGILQLSKTEIEMLIRRTNMMRTSTTVFLAGIAPHTYMGLHIPYCRSKKLDFPLLRENEYSFPNTGTRTGPHEGRIAKAWKLSFIDMNKLVSTEWNFLPDTQKMFYKDVAEVDSKHYIEQQGHQKGDNE